MREHKLSAKAEEQIKVLLGRQKELENQLAIFKKQHSSFTREIFRLSLRLPSFNKNKFRGTPPSGNLTFIFTDIQGSTKQWENDPGAYCVSTRVIGSESMFKSLELHN